MVSIREVERIIKKKNSGVHWTGKAKMQFAETTEQGRLLSYLRALQDKANETVKEASAPEELKGTLDNLFAFVGISWDRKLPPRPKQIASR